ncbi:MAG: VWA domain-containing protein, partial [Candidatus Kariarchaeaceae archaeon]
MKKIENNHFEIKAVPSTEYALEGVMNKLYVLLEIKGKKQPRPEEEKERDPIDLSLVLDRSGSMGGSKIDFAKKGVEYAVSNLRADDRVTLVIYDDQIEVLFQGNPAKKRKEFLEKIETVYARNSTAL